MSVKDVDSAKAKRKQIEAIQDEQNDIIDAENLGGADDEQIIRGNQDSLPDTNLDTEPEKLEPKPSPRDNAMAELLKRRSQERGQQEIIDDDDDDDDNDDFVNDDDDSEVVHYQQGDVEFNKPGFYGDKVVLKVDGQLVEMPADKALSLLQKTESADRRLEMASQRERELQERELALQQKSQQTHQLPNQGVDEASQAEVQEEVRRTVELLEDGETDQAVAHLTKLIAGRNPEASAQQVAAIVKKQIVMEQVESAESRLKLSGEYDDVFNDPYMYQLAVENVAALNQAGTFKGSYEDLIVEGMEQARDWRAGTTREKRLANRQDKAKNRNQRKRSLPRSVSSGNAVPRQAPKQQEEQSPQEKRAAMMANMRKARNQ